MTFDKKRYNKQYQTDNMSQIKIGVTKIDNDYFDNYCKSIGVGKSAYIKALINADAIKRGMLPIFTDKRSGKDYTLDMLPDEPDKGNTCLKK